MNQKPLHELLQNLVLCPNKIEADLLIKEVQSRFVELEEEVFSFESLLVRIREVSNFTFDEKKASESISQSEPDQLVLNILDLISDRDELYVNCENLSRSCSLAVGALPIGSIISDFLVSAVRTYNKTGGKTPQQALAELQAKSVKDYEAYKYSPGAYDTEPMSPEEFFNQANGGET
ncbi:hypothetical protein P8629_02640 [Hydrogenovibrio sp. 3SP14C1]|uniref:hypothetical protein n=1 Tax=Hydrogenovibrio sp. 3SP14C1 TaxID=3038774 RepID=UPI002417CE1B|nr:hypothetical protein [Hydrogenovibrio sp. 3SP14C1]MDG4811894.1 hypothetical protein [Hydrogenovibrio sp. 3SP14C1]